MDDIYLDIPTRIYILCTPGVQVPIYNIIRHRVSGALWCKI